MKRSKLTWDAVLGVVERAGPRGLTNRQIAGALGADVQRAMQLTLLMWEAGVLGRSQGEQDRNLTIVYFLPPRPRRGAAAKRQADKRQADFESAPTAVDYDNDCAP